jgi:hypothetical protein
MAPAPLARDEAERMLSGLAAAHDQLAAAMYGLDSHPALLILRGGTLTGRTAERAGSVTGRLTVLWAHFSAAGDLLEAARTVRARHGRPTDEDLAELTALLRDPIIGLDADGLPADGTGKPVARRLGLYELLPTLTADCAALAAELSEVETAAGAVAARLGVLSDGLAELRATLAALDDESLAGTDSAVAAALEPLGAELLADPLTAAPGGTLTAAASGRLDALAGELSAASARLADATALRTGYGQRRARLVELLSAVDDAEAAARTAYEAVAAKIADPGLPPLPATGATLRGRLGELDDLHRHGAWVRLGAAFTAAERDATAATEHAGRLRAAAEGLLARRDELRGRLEAYRAKAARLGRLEDTAVAERHRAAQRILYSAPCDLPAATRAVFAYQQALAEASTPKEGSA